MDAADSKFDSLWNPSDLPASESALRRLYHETAEAEYSMELLTWIARAEAMQGKFVESHCSLKKVEKFLEEEKEEGEFRPIKIRWLLERGRLHILQKTPSQARSLFAQAWALAFEFGDDSSAVEIAQLMSVSEPHKSQQDWITRAIGIAQDSTRRETKRWLGSLYASLGWKFYDLREYEKALEAFHEASRNFKAHGIDREAFVARWSIGKVLRTIGKTEEALAIQKELLSELERDGLRDGRIYEELAECLHALKRVTEAQSYFEMAYRELSSNEWMSDNQPLKLKRMKDLGKVK